MNNNNTINILIADDSKLTIIGLKAMLNESEDLNVIDIALDGEQAIKKSLELKPDIVLMDVGMPLFDGIEAVKEIKKENDDIKIIMLTSHNSNETVLDALSSGANSYCMKGIDPHELYNAIKCTYNGASWLDPQIAKIVLSNINRGDDKEKKSELTEREIEILALISKGLSNNKISDKLFISMNTVKTHIKNIFGKLQVADRTQAAMKAVKEDLL